VSFIKWRLIELLRLVELTGQAKELNEITVRKSESNKLPERLKHRWNDNIKTELKEIKKKVDCFKLA
jgi:hypothetical protein